MSTTILELIEGGGFDLTKQDDCNWLLGQRAQFEELVEEAEALIEAEEEKQNEIAEREYRERFPEEEE